MTEVWLSVQSIHTTCLTTTSTSFTPTGNQSNTQTLQHVPELSTPRHVRHKSVNRLIRQRNNPDIHPPPSTPEEYRGMFMKLARAIETWIF